MAITAFNVNLLAIVLAALLVQISPALRSRTGRFVLGLIVAVVIYREQVPTALFVSATTWIAVIAIERISSSAVSPRKLRWTLASAAALVIAALFIVSDICQFGRFRTTVFSIQWALLLPDMWLLLRLISFVWEYGAGRVGKLDLAAYARWLLFPFTLQGPFFRFSNFVAQEQKVEPEEHTSGFQWRTIALGAAALIVGLSLQRGETGLRAIDRQWAKALIVFVTAPWGFYLEWTGFFHLMEGAATTWGFQLPRSFHRPFGRRNVSEFWQVWNIPVTDFFRDALFYQRWGMNRASPHFNVLLVFLAVGLWHGRNLYWTTWGLLHGIGFCVFMAWKAWRGKREMKSPLLTASSAALTYVFVCLCWHAPNKIVPLLHRYF